MQNISIWNGGWMYSCFAKNDHTQTNQPSNQNFVPNGKDDSDKESSPKRALCLIILDVAAILVDTTILKKKQFTKFWTRWSSNFQKWRSYSKFISVSHVCVWLTHFLLKGGIIKYSCAKVLLKDFAINIDKQYQ